jgi:hypothetical protein
MVLYNIAYNGRDNPSSHLFITTYYYIFVGYLFYDAMGSSQGA